MNKNLAPVSTRLIFNVQMFEFISSFLTHHYDSPSDTQKLEKLENMFLSYFSVDSVKIHISLRTVQETQNEKNSVARAGGKKRFTKVTS